MMATDHAGGERGRAAGVPGLATAQEPVTVNAAEVAERLAEGWTPTQTGPLSWHCMNKRCNRVLGWHVAPGMVGLDVADGSGRILVVQSRYAVIQCECGYQTRLMPPQKGIDSAKTITQDEL